MSKHCPTKHPSEASSRIRAQESQPRDVGRERARLVQAGKAEVQRDYNSLEGQWQPLPHRAQRGLRNVGTHNT